MIKYKGVMSTLSGGDLLASDPVWMYGRTVKYKGKSIRLPLWPSYYKFSLPQCRNPLMETN